MKLLLRLIFVLFLGLPFTANAQELVYRVEVSGTIEMGLAPFVARAIAQAEELGVRAVVLDMETPGGRIDAAQIIAKAVSQSTVPVFTLVNQHAWSAGALIALAGDSIYMVPGSSIGAATPIIGAEKASEKIVSAMRGEFRALAERRGLDPRIAEAMVDEAVEVEGIIEAGKLLTLTAGESVDIGLAAAEVESLEDMLELVGLEDAIVETVTINWAESLVRFLSNPMVAPLLLTLGTLGLIVEIKTPSFGLAGAVGLLSFGAFFGSHLIIGLAGWEEVILLGAGIIALGLE
ncbi:MAG: ATP-dependent Clp protease proteolytic subunit, partial [Gemmatimonadota bacterium]|nr:ATP-dependent Clp protease proteolytic subunit [Gemmatimonadota bacterium]